MLDRSERGLKEALDVLDMLQLISPIFFEYQRASYDDYYTIPNSEADRCQLGDIVYLSRHDYPGYEDNEDFQFPRYRFPNSLGYTKFDLISMTSKISYVLNANTDFSWVLSALEGESLEMFREMMDKNTAEEFRSTGWIVADKIDITDELLYFSLPDSDILPVSRNEIHLARYFPEEDRLTVITETQKIVLERQISKDLEEIVSEVFPEKLYARMDYGTAFVNKNAIQNGTMTVTPAAELSGTEGMWDRDSLKYYVVIRSSDSRIYLILDNI